MAGPGGGGGLEGELELGLSFESARCHNSDSFQSYHKLHMSISPGTSLQVVVGGWTVGLELGSAQFPDLFYKMPSALLLHHPRRLNL